MPQSNINDVIVEQVFRFRSSYVLILTSSNREETEETEQTKEEKMKQSKITQLKRIQNLRNKCLEAHTIGLFKIKVSRNILYLQSKQELLTFDQSENSKTLNKRLYIQYQGEHAIDEGGPLSEWFLEFSKKLFDPSTLCFRYTNAARPGLIEIDPTTDPDPTNPNSDLDQNVQSHYICAGRLLALAIFNSKFVYPRFSVAFYKLLLEQWLREDELLQEDASVTHEDELLQEDEEEVSLDELKKMDLDFIKSLMSMEMADLEELHKLQKRNSNTIKSIKTKKGLVLEIGQWYLYDRYRKQMKKIKKGFEDVFPISWLKGLSVEALEELISGVYVFEISKLRAKARYGGYDKKSKQIKWFWMYMSQLKTEDLEKLLQFIFGTSKFGSCYPTLQINKVKIPDALPSAHTCCHILNLPNYNSFDVLKSKMDFAIKETVGFGFI
ncbi:hypothetical protein QYM36_019895 [Artemia franciscana]|uniref:HECT-type E3 ubiquitin transferase n=1 Tax=Artemia franciscana TaxID=6661 RepID=A0AA88H9S2_ARTSF|nr:hypothetical protein QYM36_019895 [Artemia franciscana]